MTDTASAFAPFFSDEVVVACPRNGQTVQAACCACVLDGGRADLDPEAVAANGENAYTVLIDRNACGTLVPAVGDRVTDAWGRVLKVTCCEPDGEWWRLECKSKGGPLHD